MVKIKICGLSQSCDAEYVNEAMPDYAGFVFWPKSRRSIAPQKAKKLRKILKPSIVTVGVFVNETPENIVALVTLGVISIIQLHGNENNEYIARLRKFCPACEIWQAFTIRSRDDLERAANSTADTVLLDSGKGTGKTFDHNLIGSFPRPFILAGGLEPKNILETIRKYHPISIDLSSGVETNGAKDKAKILAAVMAARS